jgi:murein DD-endopeptidase MepM/ murein hydrolase activator NlpD
MKPPLSILVVHGDGTRVLRFTVPRWIGYVAVTLEAAVVAATIGLAGDLTLRSDEIEALRDHADHQRVLLDSFESRLPGIRNEIAGWKALHAKMWKVFAPEVPRVAPQSSAELEGLANEAAEEGPRLAELEHAVDRTGKLLSALPIRWPLRGPVKSEFGTRRSPWDGTREHHEGLDIGSPTGTPIKSPAAGTVIAATSWGDFGKHVTIEHGNGLRSFYGHLSALEVKAGQTVEKGQVIGLVGSTGKSTGPHLHYELLVEGKPVDPRGFLGGR